MPHRLLHEIVDSLSCPPFHVVCDIHGDGGQGCKDDACVVYVAQSGNEIRRGVHGAYEVAEGSDDDCLGPGRGVGGSEGIPERKKLSEEAFAKAPVFRHLVEQIGLRAVPCVA